ncbi:ER protein BIG1 [Nemania sp. FL0916]|nr:ER protein BIG1 [Nemania sp. FL0916]
MRPSVTAAIAGFCATAHAFSDSSPFILFSTAKLSNPLSADQLQSSSRIFESTKQLLSSCPTSHYLFVSQPNLNAEHLRSKASVPKLSDSLSHATSSYSVAEVAGELDVRSIATYIRETCDLPLAAVDVIELSPVPSAAAESVKTLKENDGELGLLLDQYKAVAGDSYTVIYAGGARAEKPETYTPEFTDSGAGHSELKRQLHDVKGVRRQEQKKNLPLFEKYQFFTPGKPGSLAHMAVQMSFRANLRFAGIFMSLIAFIVLMSILYGGISALASLQVSYGAFDKEMGPAAQKKQQ